MLHAVDHPLIAVRDLDAAAACYAALLGKPPGWRGVHPGAGIANALFRVANASLELLSPDGEGPVGRMLTAALEGSGEGLVALAFATDDAEACATELRGRGIDAGDPREGEGRDPGTDAVHRWRTVEIPLTASHGLPLFAIERNESSNGRLLRQAPPGARSKPSDGDRLRQVPRSGARSEPSDGRLLWQAPTGARSEPQASEVSRLDHVVVTTSHLDAARRFYGDGLGLRLALDRRFEARGLRILFFRVGGVTVEVVGPLASAETPARVDRFGGLAWGVVDADAARKNLAARFDVSEVRAGHKPGTRVFSVRSDTCGVPTLFIGG